MEARRWNGHHRRGRFALKGFRHDLADDFLGHPEELGQLGNRGGRRLELKERVETLPLAFYGVGQASASPFIGQGDFSAVLFDEGFDFVDVLVDFLGLKIPGQYKDGLVMDHCVPPSWTPGGAGVGFGALLPKPKWRVYIKFGWKSQQDGGF